MVSGPFPYRASLSSATTALKAEAPSVQLGMPYAPQVERQHYFADYDDEQRWSSYWIQIAEALQFDGPLLEIGIGSGLVVTYLRAHASNKLTTVDIDPDLHPDIVADIVALPFEDRGFDCAMAFEVLEHLPFDRSALALAELRRVARHAVISVPDAGFCVQIRASARGRSKLIRLEMPWLLRRQTPRGGGQHFWELNIAQYPRSRLLAAIHRAGWQVSREFRNPNNVYHHFYVLV